MTWLIRFFFYSNLYVVVVIGALLLQNSWIFGSEEINQNSTWFVLAATLFLYPFHRVYGVQQLSEASMMERHEFVSRNRTIVWIIAAIGFLATCWFGWQLPLNNWIIHSLVGVIGVLYVLPIIPYRGKWIKLREVPFLKVFFIAMVVSYLTTVFIVDDLSSQVLWAVFIIRFLFLVAVTIPFDIRDYGIDKWQKLQTLPAVLGIEKAIKWALISNLLFNVVCFIAFFFFDAFSIGVFLGFVASEIYANYWVRQSKPIQSEIWFATRIEGSIVIQTVFVGVGHLLTRV